MHSRFVNFLTSSSKDIFADDQVRKYFSLDKAVDYLFHALLLLIFSSSHVSFSELTGIGLR